MRYTLKKLHMFSMGWQWCFCFYCATALGLVVPAAQATAQCDSGAWGTSRTLVLPREGAAYGEAKSPSLPLKRGEVVLTFDDGPQNGSTLAVLAALEKECALATFFVNGDPLSRNVDVAQHILAAGHSIGMHGYNHSHFAELPKHKQLADLQKMEQIYRKTLGVEPAAYRFPYLEQTPVLLAALREQKVTVMSVDVAIDDWLPSQSPDMLAERLLRRLKEAGGGIILMHDAQQQTADALPLLLDTLKTNDYRLVHIVWR